MGHGVSELILDCNLGLLWLIVSQKSSPVGPRLSHGPRWPFGANRRMRLLDLQGARVEKLPKTSSYHDTYPIIIIYNYHILFCIYILYHIYIYISYIYIYHIYISYIYIIYIYIYHIYIYIYLSYIYILLYCTLMDLDGFTNVWLLGRDSPPSGRAFRPKATPLGLGRGFSALGKAITWGEEKQPMNDWLVVLTKPGLKTFPVL